MEGYEARGPFPVFVARPGTAASEHIERGAGIVGHPDDVHVAPDGSMQVFFEGNAYGGEAMRLFANRVALAAERCRWRKNEQDEWVSYPTESKLWADPSDLVHVGVFDDRTGAIHLTVDPAILRAWLGAVPDLAAELQATGLRYERPS